jgi:hypothetical protein
VGSALQGVDLERRPMEAGSNHSMAEFAENPADVVVVVVVVVYRVDFFEERGRIKGNYVAAAAAADVQ